MSQRIHLNDETVINDAVRLHKFAFIDLYHHTFNASVKEAEYAWHKCRASKSGRLLTLQVGGRPLSAEQAAALAKAVPRPKRPPVSVDWGKGDMVHFVDRQGKDWLVPILRVFVHTDDCEYVQYRDAEGRKKQVLVKRVRLIKKREDFVVNI